MKSGIVALSALLVGGTLGVLAATPWQDAKAKSKPDGAAAMPFSEAEMAAFQKNMTPGPQHLALAKLAGSWNVTSKWWMAPDTPAQEGTGTAEFKTIFGGRFLTEDFTGTSAMGAFHGMGLLAYNNATGQWEHVWLDDMSTGLMFSQGVEKSGATTLNSTYTCPMTNELVSSRVVVKMLNDNERTVEMWSTYPGKPEFQSMSLHYKRSGAAPAKPGAR